MRNLGLLLLCGAASGLWGCVVDHELGDTDSADGPGTGNGPGGTGSSGDGGSQSNTSTPPGTDSGSDDASTDSGSDDGSTTGTSQVCFRDEDFVFMESDGDPFVGLSANFAVVLGGTCTAAVEAFDTIDTYLWEVDLSCTVSGRIDQDDQVVDAPLELSLHYASFLPSEAFTGSLASTMQLRLVADWWGMGWNRWVVLERADGVIVLDSFDGQIIDPLESSLAEDVAQLLGGDLGEGEPPAPWHGELVMDLAEADCALDVSTCGAEARGLEVGWQSPSVTLDHAKGTTAIGTTVEELAYGVFAESVIEHVPPTCLDTPAFELSVTAWAIEP